jgi:hypothetical protein
MSGTKNWDGSEEELSWKVPGTSENDPGIPHVSRDGCFFRLPPGGTGWILSHPSRMQSDPPAKVRPSILSLGRAEIAPVSPMCVGPKKVSSAKNQILRLAHNINRLRVARFDKYWVWNPRGAEGKLSILWSPITHLYGLFMQCNELQDATHCKVELPSAESKFQKQNYLMQVT